MPVIAEISFLKVFLLYLILVNQSRIKLTVLGQQHHFNQEMREAERERNQRLI